MSLPLLLTIGIGLLVLAGLFYLLLHRRDPSLLLQQQMDQLRQSYEGNFQEVNKQLANLTGEVGRQLRENFTTLADTNRHVGDRLDNAARVVGEVQNRLGKIEEANNRIFEVGKDISRLQEILQAPKLRGSLGELFLGDLLSQVLPADSFTLQHTFKGGEKVDAIIRSSQGLIPIDSKFPLENFKRILTTTNEEERKAAKRIFIQDVRRHIDSIATKYIRPDEGTLEFALMYIPAENVFYEIVLKEEGVAEKDLLRYAQDKRVFPVSPNSFYAYLQTISIGLKGMRLAEGVREVLDNLSRLKVEFGKFGNEFRKLGTHLGHARGSYEETDKQFSRLGERLESLEIQPGERSSLRVLKGADSV